ncbi:hypothetical protein WJX74_009347, partial [Apatococcus lobatus]
PEAYCRSPRIPRPSTRL